VCYSGLLIADFFLVIERLKVKVKEVKRQKMFFGRNSAASGSFFFN